MAHYMLKTAAAAVENIIVARSVLADLMQPRLLMLYRTPCYYELEAAAWNESMACKINIYSFFQISEIIISDIRNYAEQTFYPK